MRILPIVLLVFILLACQRKDNSEGLNKSEMSQFVSVYAEYLKTLAADSLKIPVREQELDSILLRNKMSKHDFERAIAFFKHHPEDFVKMLAQLNAALGDSSLLKMQKQK